MVQCLKCSSQYAMRTNATGKQTISFNTTSGCTFKHISKICDNHCEHV